MHPTPSCERRHPGLAALCLLLAGSCAALVWGEPGPSVPAPAPGRPPNRLINEQSPYLRQHAYNPVDWYPWGEEAFAKARREHKPIFLSIGYSTCHWCHVMAHESFENEATARQMNASFVCIKVDREERPDLDAAFLAYVQATTGGGGWPMTVFLTPDLKPFFGGSYFPPEDRPGRPGLRSILTRMADSWKADPGSIVAHANRVVAELARQMESVASSPPLGDRALEDGYREIAGSFDAKSGGFGGAPKFPRPVVLTFLFRVYAADPASGSGRHALEMALFTLRRIAAGGIHDPIGGGFHRYSVDGSWQVPHFEKMLYDQAQLAEAYLTAFQITREPIFASTARDILDYVRRDMTSGEGGFYSAEDADSLIPGEKQVHGEGAFYVWTAAQIEGAVGKERARLFDYYFGVEPGGNVRDDPQGEFSGKNILMQRHTVADAASAAGLGEAAAQLSLDESRRLLYAARSGRPRPGRDDKVLTSWNGLMISAYARGFQVLNEPAYLETARRAAAFVEKTMCPRGDGALLRSYCGGQAAIGGFADDYAYLVQGLLDLYEASFDVHWLQWARQLQDRQNAVFWDPAAGGYFGTDGRDSSVPMRMKDGFDGAEPSVNSASALNLLRLSALFDDNAAHAQGEQLLRAFSGQIHRAPSNYPQMLVALDWVRHPAMQIVIAGPAGRPDTLALLAEMNRHFIPRKVVLLADGGSGQKYLGQQLEFIRGIPDEAAGASQAYVCQNYSCRLPTGDIATFAALLVATKSKP